MHIDAYYNGIFSNKKDIKIPLTDRAVFFGDGIYDAAIGRNGKIFMLKEHIDRFLSNAKAVDIPFCMDREKLKLTLERLARNSRYECFFLYFQLSRYSKERIHAYPETKLSNLLITITPIAIPNPKKKLTLTLAEDIRHSMCNIKTLNLIPAVLASHNADALGKDETVLVRDETVTECAHSNIHIIKNSKLITHPLDNFILPGISRMHLIKVCKKNGIEIIERKFGTNELFAADEVIVTSTSKLAMRVKSIDKTEYRLENNSIGSKLCDIMHSEFMEFTNK